LATSTIGWLSSSFLIILSVNRFYICYTAFDFAAAALAATYFGSGYAVCAYANIYFIMVRVSIKVSSGGLDPDSTCEFIFWPIYTKFWKLSPNSSFLSVFYYVLLLLFYYMASFYLLCFDLFVISFYFFN
jgi:hypothetical protein